jgi:hypothetical protein
MSKTITDHGKQIAKLTAALEVELAEYYALCPNAHGIPTDRKKQLAILRAYIVANLTTLALPGMADQQRWLALRPESGLIVK